MYIDTRTRWFPTKDIVCEVAASSAQHGPGARGAEKSLSHSLSLAVSLSLSLSFSLLSLVLPLCVWCKY